MDVFRRARRFFLPSKTFWRYLTRLYITRFSALLIGVVAILQLLDLLSQSDAILAGEGATQADLRRYVALRLPDLISRFIPFTALLALLAVLAQMAQSSEIVIMKASGLSPHRVLMPLGVASALIASVHFAFDQFVTAPAVAELSYWQRYDYAADLPPPPEVLDELWLKDNGAVVRAEAVSRSGGRIVLDNVTVFERGAGGFLTAILRAEFAWFLDGQWTLFEVRRFDPLTHEISAAQRMDWDLAVPPERLFSLNVVPEQVSFSRLMRSIRQLGSEGLPTERLETDLLQKIAHPLSTLIMPLLGAVAGFGVARRGRLFARVAIGMGLGFSFFVADNFFVAMGRFGTLPPAAAAFGPMLLFATIALAVLFYTEE